jgi:polar amino acid transport system permease protein
MVSYLPVLMNGVWLTVVLTTLGFAIGALGGVPIVAMRMSRILALRWFAVAWTELVRGIPPVAWLFIIYFGIGGGILTVDKTTAAILTFGICSTAYMAEIYRAAIQSIPRGQWEAARTIGLSRLNVMRRVILPQALVIIVPPAATYAIGLVKETALASLIAVSDITHVAYALTQQTLDGLRVFSAAALLYLVISIPMGIFSRWIGAIVNKATSHA